MKVLLCMFYLHLIDDYVLQGILAKLKQREFWFPYGEKYKHDYIVALLEHGFMNSFAVHIPIYLWLCQNEKILLISVLIFAIIHFFIDHLKANCKMINLIQDQILHIVFIIVWWISFTLLGGML